MNPSYRDIITAADADRRDLFLGAAARLGTAVQNVEKDFWVCWTLDVLFNGLAVGGPRLLFKGGTSLSKAFGLISRFSEDIDITVFRDDLGQAADVAELEALSGKKRRARLESIRRKEGRGRPAEDDRRVVPADRPAEGRTRFFGRAARTLPAAERRAMIGRGQGELSVVRQCALLDVARSSLYYRPRAAAATHVSLTTKK